MPFVYSLRQAEFRKAFECLHGVVGVVTNFPPGVAIKPFPYLDKT